MSLSGTLQGNGITATLQATLPPSNPPQYIAPFNWPNYSSTESTIFDVGTIDGVVNGASVPTTLLFGSTGYSTPFGWYFWISIARPAGTANLIFEGTIDDYNASPVAVQHGDGIGLNVEYAGVGLLPQFVTMWCQNTFDNGQIYGFQVRFDPEPA